MFDADPDDSLTLLRLHADLDGVVWYGHDGVPFGCTSRSVEDFCHNPDSLGLGLSRARAVRLLGVPDNAPLILALKKYHKERPKTADRQTVLLGSPQIVPGAVLRASPEAVLQAMWQPGATAAGPGCWHRMSGQEYTTYAIIDELKRSGGQPGDMARRTLRYHPAWPALSFLAGLREDAACKLVAQIVEPRWFRHPFRPGRLSRLNSYLGLTPDNMAAFTGAGPPGRHYDRAELVLDTWAFGFKSSAAKPGGFLHRIADLAPEGEYHTGLLKASLRFVRLLFEVWTAESNNHPDGGFDPHRFFKRPAEALAYAAHREQLRV